MAACVGIEHQTGSSVPGMMEGGGDIQPWQPLHQQPGWYHQQVQAFPPHQGSLQQPPQASQLGVEPCRSNLHPVNFAPDLPPLPDEFTPHTRGGGPADQDPQQAEAPNHGSLHLGSLSDKPTQQLQLSWVWESDSAKKKRGGRRKKNNREHESYDDSAVKLDASYRELERQLNEPL